MSNTQRTDYGGVATGALAFSLWGLLPIYFKVAEGVTALEMLMHRIVWAVPVGLVIILARRQWPQVRQVLRERRTTVLLMVSAALIAVNWLGYIYAVQSGNIFQASLGYYINPLMLVLVGFAVLGERLTRLQSGAVVLAAAGVLVLTVQGGSFPWISLMLATSFTLYGLIRKQANVAAMPGLFVETMMLFPPAIVFLVLAIHAGTSPFGPANPAMSGILLLAGPFTVIPLLLFAIAARRLRLATIGFLQFIAPTGQFLVGLAYGEQLTTAHIICFSLIWGAVALFVFDAVRATARPPR